MASSTAALSSTMGDQISSRILSVAFNSDGSAFAVALENGYRVYSIDPIKELYRQEFEEGGIGLVAILDNSNLIAMVGGGHKPRFPVNKVMLWDSKSSKFIAELEFRSQVLGLKMFMSR